MKGSQARERPALETLSRQRKYLTLLVWVVGVCLAFGVYTLLVGALARDPTGEPGAPLHSLAAPAQGMVVKIDPVSRTVGMGTTFSVTVAIEEASDLGAFQFELTYDSSCIQTVSPCSDAVTLGSFLGSTGRTVYPLEPTCQTGKVDFGAYSLGATPAGPDGDGVLAAVTFRAGTSACSSDLHLQDVAVTDTEGMEQSHTTEDGEVRVVESSPPEVSSISPTWGHVDQVLENVTVEGDNFQTGASVRLTKSGESPIQGSSPTVQSSTRIRCTLDLEDAALGEWTVRVTNPDGQFDELADGFTVKAVVYLPLALKNY